MIRSIQNANDTAFEALQNCRCRSNYKRRNAVTTGVCKIWVVTDEAGMTVYTFDKDRAGKSVCYRGCASTWPPVAAADIPLGPDFGVVTRGDGTGQAGYRGKPLYLYSGDKKPGDTSGDSIQSVWHVIPRNAVSSMSSEPETIWRGSSYLLR